MTDAPRILSVDAARRWVVDRGHRPVLAAVVVLLVVALIMRVGRFGSDAWFDEAWYYYLTKTWGTQGHLVQPPDDIGAQIAYRPLFFALFWPVAQLGLGAARVGNLLLSLGLVLATFRLGLRAGGGTLLSFLAALIVAANPTCAYFGVILTTDTSTALFLVLAVTAGITRAHATASALMSAAVLCKESSVVVAGALLVGCLLDQWRPVRAGVKVPRRTRAIWWLVLPIVLVGLTQAVGLIAFRGRMTGWGTNLDISTFLSMTMVGYVALAAAVILLLHRRWIVLLAAASLPVFYVGWVLVLRRGVVHWYGVSLLPFVAVAHAIAFGDASAWLANRRPMPPWVRLAGASAALTLATPWAQWWPYMHWPWLRPALDGQQQVARALAKDRPRAVALVSCFWTFAHFPLRPSGATARKYYSENQEWGTTELRRLRSKTREMDAIVYCSPATDKVRTAAYASECVLFENEHYLVLRGPNRCDARQPKKSSSRRVPPRVASASSVAAVPDSRPKASKELGAADVRLDACAAVGKNGVIQVDGCPRPFVVFGPYLTLPAGVEVEISFELRAETDVTVFTEVVSDAGRRRHGSLLPEIVSAGEAQSFDYRVRLEQATESLETRVGLDEGQSARFELSRLAVRIWQPERPVNAPPEPSARNR